MNLAILETSHFQYTITQAEIFADANISIITTAKIKHDIIDYAPETASFTFHIIQSIAANEKEIIQVLSDNQIDTLLISPVFDSYAALNRIVKTITCRKVLTTHNINTWFNARFWSPNSLRDRLNMRSIIRHSHHIAVEDFIYNYLKNTNHPYFRKHHFIHIPFTIFHPHKTPKYHKTDTLFRIVLPGYIDGDRRNYNDILKVITHFAQFQTQITFLFAGRAKGDYGMMIQQKLKDIKSKNPGLVSYFDDDSTADMFRHAMETSDIVVSASNKTFRGMGTTEYIGKTKPTAAIHDMITYQLPGLLPSHLLIPENLKGSAFNYSSVEDLIQILSNLLNNPALLSDWKQNAKQNSLHFTPQIIRKNLPF